jgi:hypothetical protein
MYGNTPGLPVPIPTDEQDWYICQLEDNSCQWYTSQEYKVKQNTLGLG